jgi:hypothetical protein
MKISAARAAFFALVVLGLAGCDNMDDMQQRMVSGGAIGVATGAVGTAVTGGCIACGMAIGGAVGTAGGYIVHELDLQTRGSGSSSLSNGSSNSASANNGAPQGYPPGGYGSN